MYVIYGRVSTSRVRGSGSSGFHPRRRRTLETLMVKSVTLRKPSVL